MIKTISNKLAEFSDVLAKSPILTKSLYFYWLVAMLDWISSVWAAYLPDTEEQNPFDRNAAMRFVLHKGIIVDIGWFIVFSSAAYFIYKILEIKSPKYAQMGAASLFAYRAFDRLYEAVYPNFLLDLKFYVPEQFTVIIKHMR